MAHTQQTGKKTEWNRTSIMLALAGCVVVGLLIFFGIRLFTQQSQNNTAISSTQAGQSSVVRQQAGQQGQGTPPAGTGQGYPPAFLTTVRQQIAQGLHLTVDQVTVEVSAGKQIADVAVAQGISTNQLHTLELNAYQTAFDQAVHNGTYTQNQAHVYMENYQQRNPGQLNDNVTALFGGTSGTSQAGG